MEKSLDTNDTAFSKYIKTRDEYYRNMEIALSNKKFRKASELLWGVITQSIKALASLSGIWWTKHGKFFDFTREVSGEMNDPEYHKLFLELNALHENFYDEKIAIPDFPLYLDRAKLFLEKNQEFIEKKIEEMRGKI